MPDATSVATPLVKRLLLIPIEEPVIHPDVSTTFSALAENSVEAEHRYRAIIAVLLEQLEGLTDCHVRFIVSPDDATEAVAFWLLPLLRGTVKMEENIYYFTPKKNAHDFTIEFLSEKDHSNSTDSFEKIATLNPFCIECSSRWINMAFLQTKPEQSICGTGYLEVTHQHSSESCTPSSLPDLPIVKNESDWKNALNSSIGGKLKKAYTSS